MRKGQPVDYAQGPYMEGALQLRSEATVGSGINHTDGNEPSGSPLKTSVILLTLFCSSMLLPSCSHSPKQAQYKVQGERLYQQYCANCHQADGTGLGRLYPPLAGSDYLRDQTDGVICLIKNGIDGPLTVNGIIYNQPMPGNPALTDLEIAELVTFLRMEWTDKGQLTETSEVRKTLDNCGPSD